MIPARLVIDPHFVVGPINRRLFGSFVEHLGRCVYDGIYEPGHPTADEHGYPQRCRSSSSASSASRRSAIRAATSSRATAGRTASGRAEDRPRRLDLAWHSTETNQVGIDEFAIWLKKVDSEMMYAVNLGTRGVQEALDVLEYANIRSGTALSDQRIANGTSEPHNVRMWCLGNEMDGPWQLGHGTARDYAQLASKTARAMRQIDPDLELVVCGSSSAQMPTFGEWERVVLEETYDDIDFISCHAYYEPVDGDYGELPGVGGRTWTASSTRSWRPPTTSRRCAAATRPINISFDEWNVWYQSRYQRGRPHHRGRRVAGGPSTARGRLFRRRCRRLRQPADLA